MFRLKFFIIIIIVAVNSIIPKHFTVICLYFIKYLEMVSVDKNTTRMYQMASINEDKQEINNLFSKSNSDFRN